MCFTGYVSYFNIPYWGHEGHCHCQNNIPNTIPYHSIICTAVFTLPSCKLYHHLKIRPVSASVHNTARQLLCKNGKVLLKKFPVILFFHRYLVNVFVAYKYVCHNVYTFAVYAMICTNPKLKKYNPCTSNIPLLFCSSFCLFSLERVICWKHNVNHIWIPLFQQISLHF